MSEMIERVAKALCAFEGVNWNAAHFNETPSGNTPEEMREGYYLQARAAIEAMREPPQGETLQSAISSCLHGNADFEKLWTTLIDAALSQPPHHLSGGAG